jgi:hypothetical protein
MSMGLHRSISGVETCIVFPADGLNVAFDMVRGLRSQVVTSVSDILLYRVVSRGLQRFNPPCLSLMGTWTTWALCISTLLSVVSSFCRVSCIIMFMSCCFIWNRFARNLFSPVFRASLHSTGPQRCI